MPYYGKKYFNKLYPLRVWCTTLLVGTGLHLLTSSEGHNSASNDPYFVELMLGVHYSLITLLVSYVVFYFLTKTELTYKTIKPIIAFTGVVCCAGTLMYKFNFWFDEFDNREYLNLIASYCLPLIASCFLLRLKSGRGY